jgi:hypothetical protein
MKRKSFHYVAAVSSAEVSLAILCTQLYHSLPLNSRAPMKTDTGALKMNVTPSSDRL